MTRTPNGRRLPLWIGVLAAGAVALASIATAQTPRPDAAARPNAMAGASAALEALLTRSGAGTWDRWWQRLQPVRDEFTQLARGSRRGAHGYVLNKNAVDYLTDADLDAGVNGTRPRDVLVTLDQQLKARGIDFIYLPIPAIEEVYPENHLAMPPADGIVQPRGRQFLLRLLQADVEVSDLLPVFRAARAGYGLGLKEDDHWNDRQIELAARHVAARLASYPFAKAAAPDAARYRTRAVTIAGERGVSTMSQVLTPEGRLYEDVEQSPVLVVGDSNLQVYQYTNADMRNTGEHAGFTAHLARALGMPVSLVAAGGFTPALLNREPRALTNRRVVVFVGSIVVVSRIAWPPVVLR